MFASRLFNASIPRVVRQMSSVKGTFVPKSTRAVWLGDAGAYPVMGVIVFALTMCTTWGLHTMAVDKDSRIWSKDSRKSFYRGELTYEK